MNSPSSFEASLPDYPVQAPTWKIAPQTQPRYINSVAVSADGGTVVGGTFYHSYGTAPAARRSATVADQLTKPGLETTDTFGTYCYDGKGVLRWKDEFLACEGVYGVAVSSDAGRAAAGGSGGVYHLFDVPTFLRTGVPTYSFDTGSPDAIYGVGVSTDASLFAGVVNVGSDAGLAYAATVMGGTPVSRAKIQTLRNPNSLCMDLARGVMAVADGHPDGTPGHFYLIGGIVAAPNSMVVATVQWQCPTSNMSWPVTISGDGSAAVGGSDDGSIYYFGRD